LRKPEWFTGIPPELFADLYVSWDRVEVEVSVLESVFRKHGAKRVIEFGCGVGRHGLLLAKRGFEVLLTDIVDWRVGDARNLPFKVFDCLASEPVGVFDAGYGLGLIIVFKLPDMVRAVKNMARNIKSGGILVFDYNFTTYNEPKVREVVIGGRKYRAVLVREELTPIESGLMYRYKLEVYDEKGNLIGVEESGYPLYSREVVFKALEESGLIIEEVIPASWIPENYVYELNPPNPDSAFIVLRKP